jgi:hypothetical protein
MASATATASKTARAAATASPISQKMERGSQCMRFWEFETQAQVPGEQNVLMAAFRSIGKG